MPIRAVALCVIRKGSTILLQHTYDGETGTTYCRPPGGTVEFGENSRDTVIREIAEEIGVCVAEPNLLGVTENIFDYKGDAGHEVVFIYEAESMDSSLYDKKTVVGTEGDSRYNAFWTPVALFGSCPAFKLVPDGLYQMLVQEDGSRIARTIHYRCDSRL